MSTMTAAAPTATTTEVAAEAASAPIAVLHVDTRPNAITVEGDVYTVEGDTTEYTVTDIDRTSRTDARGRFFREAKATRSGDNQTVTLHVYPF